jgi:hypothetical protein
MLHSTCLASHAGDGSGRRGRHMPAAGAGRLSTRSHSHKAVYQIVVAAAALLVWFSTRSASGAFASFAEGGLQPCLEPVFCLRCSC